jgi:hypothetical protein
MTIVYAVVPSVIGVMGIAASIYLYKRHLDNKNALSKIAEAAEFDPKKQIFAKPKNFGSSVKSEVMSEFKLQDEENRTP